MMKTEIEKPARPIHDSEDYLEQAIQAEYKYGFVTDIEADEAPKGLN